MSIEGLAQSKHSIKGNDGVEIVLMMMIMIMKMMIAVRGAFWGRISANSKLVQFSEF